MKDLKAALLMVVVFTLICGGIYPAVVTGLAHALFPKQAKGSFIVDKSGREIGSSLIGQHFSDPKYFWPRPSATADFPYNPLGSGGSNVGPTNSDYLKAVAGRIRMLRDSGVTAVIPADLVQASASGLDPHISTKAALVQIPRVAKSRGMSEDAVGRAVARQAEGRQFGVLGEPRVNVVALNRELDTMKP